MKGFLFESAQFVGRHPVGGSVRGATHHRQAVGLDLDPRFGGLRLCRRSLICEAAFQKICRHILELAPLMHGPDSSSPARVKPPFFARSMLEVPTFKSRLASSRVAVADCVCGPPIGGPLRCDAMSPFLMLAHFAPTIARWLSDRWRRCRLWLTGAARPRARGGIRSRSNPYRFTKDSRSVKHRRGTIAQAAQDNRVTRQRGADAGHRPRIIGTDHDGQGWPGSR